MIAYRLLGVKQNQARGSVWEATDGKRTGRGTSKKAARAAMK